MEPAVKLLGSSQRGRYRAECRKDVIQALNEALSAANPKTILKQKIKLKGNELIVDSSVKLDLSRYQRLLVIGGGKASANMAAAIEQILGERIAGGIVNIPDYLKPKPKSDLIEFHEATHPIPSSEGVDGVRKMLELVGKPSIKDLVICLISGGGSALLPMPLETTTLSDEQNVTNLLLQSGAEIHEINTVRKHLSGIKGGRLAQKLHPATILSLIISDVVGDRLDAIASGPTVPDSTTYADTKEILVRYGLWNKVSGRVSNAVNLGASNRSHETPKPGSKIFNRVFNVLVGTNKQSCVAAARYLKKSGYNTSILSTHIQGEAKDVGIIYAGILSDMSTNGFPVSPPAAIIAGGETTVTLPGHGKGGRNQELVLSAAFGIDRLPNVILASMDTDGVDGPTDAAGAIADTETLDRGRKLGMDAAHFLRTHNSYNFFKRLGDLIITGPTGTNVNDIMILAAPKGSLTRRRKSA
jgi:glycerate 2-kinase